MRIVVYNELKLTITLYSYDNTHTQKCTHTHTHTATTIIYRMSSIFTHHLPFRHSSCCPECNLDGGGDGGGGGQCSAERASQSSASSCAALLSQSLLISISLYSGLFNFNHCRAASTLAGQMYWYM